MQTVEINPYSDTPSLFQYDPELFHRQMQTAGSQGPMTEDERFQRWSRAFSVVANQYEIPAAWIVFKSVGRDIGTIMGGHPGALAMLQRFLKNTNATGISETTCANPNCKKEIPPGRPGRLCNRCRSTKIILPGQ